MSLWCRAAAALLAGAACVAATAESFQETLSLHPLPGGRVHASFAFELSSEDASLHHFRLLPRALVQPVAALGVREAQLSLAAGRWQYGAWGSPAADAPLDDVAVAGGAEAWALFDNASAPAGVPPPAPAAEARGRWRVLTSALAGLFCASLERMDATTVEPTHDFLSQGPRGAGTQLFHAYLPSEAICTENLTPLLKLLPCKGGAGLASLILPHAILRAEFHSVSVHARREGRSGWAIALRVHAIVRPDGGMADAPVAWTLSRLFGRALTKACPVASASGIRLHLPDTPRHVHPAPRRGAEAEAPSGDDARDDGARAPSAYRAAQRTHVYDTRTVPAPLDVHFEVHPHDGALRRAPPLEASRRVLGCGQERNTVRVALRNHLRGEAVHVRYYDQFPWAVQPLMHTLHTSAAVDAGADPADLVRYRDDIDGPFVTHASYDPAQLRGRSGQLHLTLRVPPLSTVTVTYALVKHVLHTSEHVPDPHRGIDLPPAVFVPLAPGTDAADAQPWVRARPAAAAAQASRVYAAPSLLDMAVPDFSMPYNVILFYSTFVALFFGSLLNSMIRQFYDVPQRRTQTAAR
ncbi:Subunit of the glycosylphosphatidylinositol transamidase complex-like protein [Malassezia sp. CBS 17886]|nr:Subunit of the glycosylphosphatidylinositol transamidase complex-like protein [Malassezia sp. CBS 17886]